MASAYFPPDEGHLPQPELVRIIEYCNKNNTHIIIGCDTNAHHIEWGSSDINDKDEYLLEFRIRSHFILPLLKVENSWQVTGITGMYWTNNHSQTTNKYALR
jgi:Endonuclease-reverse transcriptase